jgi:hypothetical protein
VGGVLDGAAFVLPASHLLPLALAPAGDGRVAWGLRSTLLASAHGNPHVTQQCGLPARSIHVASLARAPLPLHGVR